jgi:hypothetical protein
MKGLLIFFLIASQFCFSQNGKLFPLLKGSTLSGKKVQVPLHNGKYTVVAIAYGRDAEDDLKGWLNPIFETFIKVEHAPGSFDMADLYDVNFVFIPLINGFKKVVQEFKENTDKEFWDYIMDTQQTDVNDVRQQLGVKDASVPYFYVLNKEGVIITTQQGKYSEEKISKLEDAIE